MCVRGYGCRGGCPPVLLRRAPRYDRPRYGRIRGLCAGAVRRTVRIGPPPPFGYVGTRETERRPAFGAGHRKSNTS